MRPRGRTTVVIATRNRSRELARTLERLAALREAPPIIVVDNNSGDDTAEVVRTLRNRHPGIELIRLADNRAAVARTVGVAAARTPYVAFSDDDSWWEDGALDLAANILDRHPRVGLVAARTLVGADGHDDPVTAVMAASPLGWGPDMPGPSLLGFLACSAVVRADAYRAAGGFSPLLWFGAEEQLLSIDLCVAGWEICFVGAVCARHEPSTQRPSQSWREELELRNRLLICWMRRPVRIGIRRTWSLLVAASRDRTARGALTGALARAPHAIRQRRRVPPAVEARIALLESTIIG